MTLTVQRQVVTENTLGLIKQDDCRWHKFLKHLSQFFASN